MKVIILSVILLAAAQFRCDAAENSDPPKPPAATSNKETPMTATDTQSDLQQICQVVLDLPKLQEYFHPAEPNRKPLTVIKNSEITKEINLNKFDEPVRFIDAKEAADKAIPAFEFTSIEIKDKSAKVEFRYKVEGIKGRAELRYDQKWEVVSSELTES